MTLTSSRMKGIEVTAKSGDEVVEVLRPTSLHGAAIAVRRHAPFWSSRGVDSFEVTVNGLQTTEDQRALVEPELRKYL